MPPALTRLATLLKSQAKFKENPRKRMPILHQLFAAILGCLLGANVLAANVDKIKNLISTGDFVQAQSLIDEVLEAEPGDLQARFLSGLLLTESGDVDGAISVFMTLAKDFPELPEPHNNLAVLYAAKGDYVKARDSLLVAINTHPSYATAHENLGDIYAKMAGLAYDQALQLDRDNRTAKAKLAMMRDLVSADGVVGQTGSSPTTTVAVTATTTVEPAVEPAQTVDPVMSAQVLNVVDRWAKAWSDKNVGAYLGFYASNFRPSTGHSRVEWAKLREKRLSKPKFIRIVVDKPLVTAVEPNKATVTFMQGYQSDTYGDRVRKQLELIWENNDWKIVREFSTE